MTRLLTALAALALISSAHAAVAQDYGYTEDGATYQYGTTTITALNPPAVYAPPIAIPAVYTPPIGGQPVSTLYASNGGYTTVAPVTGAGTAYPYSSQSGGASTNVEASLASNGGSYYAGIAQAYAAQHAGNPPAPAFNPGGGLAGFNPAGTVVRRPIRGG